MSDVSHAEHAERVEAIREQLAAGWTFEIHAVLTGAGGVNIVARSPAAKPSAFPTILRGCDVLDVLAAVEAEHREAGTA